jgi:hypothetical protein
MPRALVILVAILSHTAFAGPPASSDRHIYSYQQGEHARRVARASCKPLVIHFVPESRVGWDQLQGFYARPGGVTDDLLEDVVIVVVPTQRFAGLARQLGISGAGGYRTISPYDLSPLDERSVPTCRSGFV